MSHRAAVYQVSVRRKYRRTDTRPFGDIDGEGTYLATVLAGYVPDLEATNKEKSKIVHGVDAMLRGEDLRIFSEYGQDGVDAIIKAPTGELRHHVTVDETYNVKCGCLLRLPRASETGWLVAHVNNGRSAKTLLEQGLQRRFRTEFEDLMLEITPCVVASAFRQAVEEGQIDKVTLVKRERPSDRGTVDLEKWVDAGDLGKLELTITSTAGGKTKRLLAQLLQRFVVDGAQDALDEIVLFEGMRFDEAKVLVPTKDGAKTFNIERPDAGHAFTMDTGLPAGDPEPEELFKALEEAISAVVG